MATVSDEKRMSIAMKKGMDRLSFNPALVVLDYFRSDENMQNRMMDLIMAFLHTYAEYYKNGETRPGEIMHRIGEMSVTMLSSLAAEGTGRHCADETPESDDYDMQDYEG